MNELSKEQRPPDSIIWEGTSEDLDEWLDKVIGPNKNKEHSDITLTVKDIEE